MDALAQSGLPLWAFLSRPAAMTEVCCWGADGHGTILLRITSI